MNEWVNRSISEIAELVSRGVAPRYVGTSSIRAIGQRCIRVGRFESSAARSHDESIIDRVLWAREGDVLLNSTGTGTIGRSCVYPGGGRYIVDGHVTVIRARPGAADGRFIAAVLQSPAGQSLLEKRCYSGSTNQVELSASALRNLTFRWPGVFEQRRIGEILDALDLAIGTTERLIAKLVSANSGLVESRLGELAATSTVASLASVADIGGGLALSSKRSVADPVTVPYLRVANVQDGFIDLSEVRSVTIGRRELKRFELRAGDVLMNEGGDFDKLGRGAVWDGSIARCVHQNHVFRVRCDAGRLLPKYLAICAASWRGKQYFTASSKQTTNLASINKAQLGKFPVPLVHVDQQRSFVVLVEQAEQRLKAEDAALRKLRLVRSGLAGDLLTGRIRTVPV